MDARFSKSQRQVNKTRQRISFRLRAWITSCMVLIIAGVITVYNVTIKTDSHASVTNDYRSVASGEWNALTTWQVYNGSAWIAAASAPSSSKNIIQIQSGHTVIITAGVSADQILIDDGGQLTINTGTLSLANGTGTDLIVNGTLIINSSLAVSANGSIDVNNVAILKSTGAISFGLLGFCNVNGRFKREGGSMPTSSLYWAINNGGTYQHAMNGGVLLPTGSWKSGSTCEV